MVGAKLLRADEAHVWLGAAEAAVKRLGGSEALEIEVLQQKAMVLSEAEWRPDLALEIKKRILPTYERIYGTHPKTLRAVYSLGVTESYLGHHAAATPLYERAVAMATEIGGPDYAWMAHALYGLGDSLVAEGESSSRAKRRSCTPCRSTTRPATATCPRRRSRSWSEARSRRATSRWP